MRLARTSGRYSFLIDTRWFIAWVARPRLDPRDVWVGLFHKRVYIGSPGYRGGRSFYVCVVPCVVWHFDIWRKESA